MISIECCGSAFDLENEPVPELSLQGALPEVAKRVAKHNSECTEQCLGAWRVLKSACCQQLLPCPDMKSEAAFIHYLSPLPSPPTNSVFFHYLLSGKSPGVALPVVDHGVVASPAVQFMLVSPR